MYDEKSEKQHFSSPMTSRSIALILCHRDATHSLKKQQHENLMTMPM